MLAVMYVSYDTGHGVLSQQPPLPPLYPVVEAISPDSSIMQTLARTRGPLLELPVAGRLQLSPELNARAMYRAIFHRHPLINGYSSYWPKSFPASLALAERLPDRNALQGLVERTGLEYILVHMGQMPSGHEIPWRLIAKNRVRTDLWPIGRAGKDLLFAVAHPDQVRDSN
jgi:hypothetical protein